MTKVSATFRPLQERLVREQTEQHDETYYLWALSFFMAFNRGDSFRADLVSETMTIRTFHFIERNITNYYEMILTDRKEATSWSRRWVLGGGFAKASVRHNYFNRESLSLQDAPGSESLPGTAAHRE